MPRYSYIAMNQAGRRERGSVAAESPRDAREKVGEKGLYPVKVWPAARTGASPASLAAAVRRRRSAARVTLFTRQFATLLQSGVTVTDALASLVRHREDRAFAAAIESAREDVAAGSSVSEAFAAHPEYFDHFYVAMVRAAEASGSLGAVAEHMAETLERREELRGKVAAAMAYPAIVLLVAAGVVGFLVTSVVPKIADMLERQGSVLPLSTRVLMGVSRFARDNGVFILGAVVVAVLVLAWLRQRPRVRFLLDALVYRLPLFAGLFRMSATARLSAALSALLRSGIPLVTALDIASRLLDNRYFEDQVRGMCDAIRDGADFSAVLEGSSLFPPMIGTMAAVGEKSGTLDEALARVARGYERELDVTARRLVAMLEPAVVVAMAGVIGFIVLAVIRPILEASKF